MKLLIRNLNSKTTEEELKAIFETYGTVQYCNIVMDKKMKISKRFGFIEMPKIGDAKAAMIHLNNKEIAGCKVRVKKAEPITEKNKPRQQNLMDT